MLAIATRQRYLKSLGFYNGEINGKEDKATRDAYKALQDKYFTRAKDRDGLYGPNTEILLKNAYYVNTYAKNFELTEFKCDCKGKYCTGYPVVINVQLLKNAQLIRRKYGPTLITSGLRCQKYNDSIPGSIKNSYHVKGMAIDYDHAKTHTLANRKKVMAFWKTLPKAGYTYCNENGNHPNMGNSIHGQVEK